MNIMVQENGSYLSVDVQGEMTIPWALQCKTGLLAQLKQRRSLKLSLAGVYEIDSAGLQVLVLLQREAAQQGVPLTIGAVSSSVDEFLRFCGLGDQLADATVIPVLS